jgi:hypothetical protein
VRARSPALEAKCDLPKVVEKRDFSFVPLVLGINFSETNGITIFESVNEFLNGVNELLNFFLANDVAFVAGQSI